MTVRQQRAHAEFVGQGEGSAGRWVSAWSALRGIAPRRNLAEQAQDIRLVAPFAARSGECQRALGEGVASSRRRPADALRQMETTERLIASYVRRSSVPAPA